QHETEPSLQRAAPLTCYDTCYVTSSGVAVARYALNLPEQFKEKAHETARKQGVSLNQFILWALAEKMTHTFATEHLMATRHNASLVAS
ncbi:MAG: toxin-antitoxin system HicB family antitoxin, partial [Anaerolineae bacterium]